MTKDPSLGIKDPYELNDKQYAAVLKLLRQQKTLCIAQGAGQALMEAVAYDSEGQLLSGTLMDYALPRASDLPSFRTARQETRSPDNILGVKGVGESGTIGAPAAVVNAVVDALAPLGVSHLDMPLTPYRVWNAIQSSRGTK